MVATFLFNDGLLRSSLQRSNFTYFHSSGRAVVVHASHATVGTWLDHPRKPSEPSLRWCFRRFFCASIWTWSIFAFFRKHFSDKICMVEGMSSGRRRLQREMWNPFHLWMIQNDFVAHLGIIFFKKNFNHAMIPNQDHVNVHPKPFVIVLVTWFIIRA